MSERDLLPGRDVSRETLDRLELFTSELTRWNERINLVSRRDLESLWARHVVDSAQIFNHVPTGARTWVDLGSGAGFPGLVCAIIGRELFPDLQITLVEVDARKSSFLREASRKTGAKTEIVTRRIEEISPQPYDIVTARALAPLPKILGLAHRFYRSGTKILLHKGQSLESELTEASAIWNITGRRIPSVSDGSGTIFEITELAPRQ